MRAAAKGTDGLTGSASTTFSIDRTVPTVAITFPVASGWYATASWNAGCTSKICGTAADATSGLASAKVSIRQGTGNYWNGTSFASASEVLFTATGTTGWSLAFPASNFIADGAYTVRAMATDNAGNTATTSNTFTRDTIRSSATGVVLSDADGTVESQDEFRVTFSQVLDVSTICSSWSGAGDQVVGGSGVVATFTATGTSDTLTVAAAGCTFGTLVTGDHVATTATFSGSTSFTETRVTWTAATRLLTVHLGSRTSGTVNTAIAATTVSYTPSPAFEDLAGNQIQPTAATGTLRF